MANTNVPIKVKATKDFFIVVVPKLAVSITHTPNAVVVALPMATPHHMVVVKAMPTMPRACIGCAGHGEGANTQSGGGCRRGDKIFYHFDSSLRRFAGVADRQI